MPLSDYLDRDQQRALERAREKHRDHESETPCEGCALLDIIEQLEELRYEDVDDWPEW